MLKITSCCCSLCPYDKSKKSFLSVPYQTVWQCFHLPPHTPHCEIPSEEEVNTQSKIIKILSDRAPEHKLSLMNSPAAPQGFRALLALLQLGTLEPALGTHWCLSRAPWQESSGDTQVSLWLHTPHLLIEFVSRAPASFFYTLGMIIKALNRTFSQI